MGANYISSLSIFFPFPSPLPSFPPYPNHFLPSPPPPFSPFFCHIHLLLFSSFLFFLTLFFFLSLFLSAFLLFLSSFILSFLRLPFSSLLSSFLTFFLLLLPSPFSFPSLPHPFHSLSHFQCSLLPFPTVSLSFITLPSLLPSTTLPFTPSIFYSSFPPNSIPSYFPSLPSSFLIPFISSALILLSPLLSSPLPPPPHRPLVYPPLISFLPPFLVSTYLPTLAPPPPPSLPGVHR